MNITKEDLDKIKELFSTAEARIQYTPPPAGDPGHSAPEGYYDNNDDALDDLIKERDRILDGLLAADEEFDLLDQVIQDQIKNMNIPATNSTKKAIEAFGGNTGITAEIYNKAYKTMRTLSPLFGYEPSVLPFARPSAEGLTVKNYLGDALKDCKSITADFPNLVEGQLTPDFRNMTPEQIKEQADRALATGTANIGPPLDTTGMSDREALDALYKQAKEKLRQYLSGKIFWDLLWGIPADSRDKILETYEEDQPYHIGPKAKSGFLLPILMRPFRLVGLFIELLAKPIEKIPIVGKYLHKYVRAIGGAAPNGDGGVCWKILRWLAYLPNKAPNIICVEDENGKMVCIKEDDNVTDDKVQDTKTPGGFVPPECYEHAMTILKAVNYEATRQEEV